MKSLRLILRHLTFLLLAIFLLAASACTTFEIGVLSTPTPNTAMTGTVQAIQTSNAFLANILANPPATLTPDLPGIPTPGPTPTKTPTPSGPRFSSLRFATDPEAPAPQRFFVAGLTHIYAIWDYANMRDGMVVRRVWSLNGSTWIEREDPWDLSKYGTSGTVRDVSIFEENIGLQAGEYSLSLYIDGVRQDMGETEASRESGSFFIFPPEVRDPVSSPDMQKSAYVINGGRLVVEFSSGMTNELITAQEISSISWFPDSDHLLYAERDRTMQVVPTEDWGITHRLWIIDVNTGERHLLSTSGENFHHPQISPDGRYIVVLAGNTFGEGCFYSPSLVILEMNEDLRRANVQTVRDFDGIPYLAEVRGGIYPSDHTRAGYWEGTDKLLVNLWWLCLDTPDNPDGAYLLDLANLTALRVGATP